MGYNYNVITLIGPRQSGKTTLCKKLFPNYHYFSFESPDTVDLFETDPRGFLAAIKGNAIFDEVQKVPQVFSYLQGILDDKKDLRKFILTGSNNLNLSLKVSQSLAGRTLIVSLLPLQRNEIPLKEQKDDIDSTLLYGSYPRIYDEKLSPYQWHGDYLKTYLEKDIRSSINILDLRTFNQFLRLLAGRVGQIVNYNSLGGDAGISQPTAKHWISALQTTYICFELAPHFKNFSKRIIKSPKIYFYDTGLLCYLLRIKNTSELISHPLKGFIFENWIVAEYIKSYFHKGEEPPLYFWRDQHGHEVDLVIDEGKYLDLIEIKLSQTYHPDFFKNIIWLNQLQKRKEGTCIYGGDKKLTLNGIHLIPWNQI